jgi:hypothetical protein
MATIPTSQQNDISGTAFIAALPEWKRALWHGISAAAHARNVFDNDDYDTNGDLNPCSARFAELCTWLVCLAHFLRSGQNNHKKKLSYADEHVDRLRDVMEHPLRHSGQYDDASLMAAGN